MAEYTPKILLRSAWATSNFGDIAITPGMLNLLKQHLPNARITIHTAYDGVQIQNYLSESFPDVKWVHGHLGDTYERADPQVLQAYRDADLMLYNSGPIFDFGHAVYDGPTRMSGWRSFDWNYLMYNAAPVYAAMEAGIPWGIFGQEFNFIGPAAEPWSRDLFKRASFLYTRESESLQHLQSISVETDCLKMVPDATFAFDLPDSAGADAWMRRLHLDEGRYLPMNIRSSAMSFTSEAQERDHVTKLHRVLQQWIDRTGLPVVLFSETKSDIDPVRRLIFEGMPASYKNSMRIADEFWSPSTAFSMFKRSAGLLVMDHHSAILGLAAGVPVVHPRVPIAGRKGVIFDDLGLSDWLMDIDQVDDTTITDALAAIHASPGMAAQRVARAMDDVHTLHKDGFAVIQRLLVAHRQRPSATSDSRKQDSVFA